MKPVLILCFLSIQLAVCAQDGRIKKAGADSLSRAAHQNMQQQFEKDSALRAQLVQKARQRRTDSLSLVLQSGLKINKPKADEVLAIVNQSIDEMDRNARDREVRGEAKINRFKEIAAGRDKKIAALLTEEQVQQLQDIMRRSRGVKG